MIRDQLSHILVSRYIMLSTWVNVYFLILMTLDKTLQAYSTGPTNLPCSWYTFNGTAKSWRNSRDQCRTQGGDLVSMETVEEWEFINTQIQNRTTERLADNEWWIGLKEREDGRWQWVSNHTLKYTNMWQPGEPSTGKPVEKCVVMAKNYPSDTNGLFNNAPCRYTKGWICEFKTEIDCINDEMVKWCYDPVTPTVRVSKTSTKTTAAATTAAAITAAATTVTTATKVSDQKTATGSLVISTAVSQPSIKKATTNKDVYVPSVQSTTPANHNKKVSATTEYTTTITHQNYTDISTTTTGTEIDDNRTTAVSQSTKKPFSTLVIIIAVLTVSVVVCLCCVVVCVCGWKLKRKEKRKSRLKHDDTNTEHNTSDVIAGSSSGMQNEHELKAIVIQPNNACAQEDSHATMHDNASCNSTDTKGVAKSSHSCLVPQIVHDALAVGNHSNMTSLEPTGKEFPPRKASQENTQLTPGDTESKENSNVQSSAIYATVDKSKKKNKTTEVKKRSTNPGSRNEVTYAELAEFNHDATRSIPKPTPPYHPTEYASVSTMPVRCQAK